MTTNNQDVRNRRGLLFVGGLLIPVLTALLLGAGIDEGSRLAQNRSEIEQMTPAQRARLQRDYDEFQQLPLDQQQRYRELHRQLQTEDDAVALRVTLDRYRNWLKTLSPFEREELRAIADLDERIARVKQLMDQQSATDSPSGRGLRLSSQNLATMMQVIAEDLEIASSEIVGETKWQQHMFVLNRFVESRRGEVRGNDWTPIFDNQLIEKIVTALPAGEFRSLITNARPDDERRRIVGQSIRFFLGRGLQEQLTQYRPTQADIQSLLGRSPLERRRYENLESKAEKQHFIYTRLRTKRLYELMQPYPALRPSFRQPSRGRRGVDPPPRGFPGRGGREFGPGGPGRERRPPGSPRGFRGDEKRERFGDRRPSRKPGQ